MRLMRRMILAAVAAGVLLGQTGTAVPGLEGFDDLMFGMMGRYKIPGGSLAITRGGRLVYARGYGSVDSARSKPVEPDTLFRMPHSEMVTSVAVLKLVEQGKIDLDKPAFDYLGDLALPRGMREDTWLRLVKVRHLLQHTGGWDAARRGGYEPLASSARIVSALGVPAPASTENVIRYMRGQQVDEEPGTRSLYSSFGIAVLGRIIERVTGKNYELWVRENLLAPAGVSDMRIGQTLAGGRQAGEVVYAGDVMAPSVFADVPGPLPLHYGGFSLEGADSAGGWLGSAIDWAKFVNAVDGQRGTRLISSASVTAMTARPATPEFTSASTWLAMGNMVNTAGEWTSPGILPGSFTYFQRTADGSVYVVLFNSLLSNGLADPMSAELERGLQAQRTAVTNWPTHDLFMNYPAAEARVVAATPVIQGREGVVNGATFDRGVVSGSWFTIFGANLAATTRSWTSADIVGGALPESLDGTRVLVDGKAAFVYFISPGQINAQAPAGLTPGWKRVEVIRNGVSSGVVMAHVTANAPGALTYPLGGLTFAVATRNTTVLGDPALGAGLTTCAPGDTITIYATALVASPAGVATVTQAPLTGVGVTIGGRAATVAFAGLVSPGLFQLNVVVPDLGNGNQEVMITSGGVKSPAGVLVPVRR